MVRAYNPNTWEAEAGRLGVQVHHQLRGESEASLLYISLKKVNVTTTIVDKCIIWDNLKALEGPWSLTFDCKHTPFLWSDGCPVSTGSVQDAVCGASECSHQTPT